MSAPAPRRSNHGGYWTVRTQRDFLRDLGLALDFAGVGYRDALAGLPYPPSDDTMREVQQRAYEAGRLLAVHLRVRHGAAPAWPPSPEMIARAARTGFGPWHWPVVVVRLR